MHPHRPKCTPALLMVVLTLFITAAMLYSLFTGRSLAERYAPLAASPVTQSLQTGQRVGLESNLLLLAKDGRQYQIADSTAPIRDTTGKTAKPASRM